MMWQRISAVVMVGLGMWLGGCGSMGSIAEMEEKPRPKPPAVYEGLGGQKVAIMVWADWRTRTEGGFSQIQLDLARLLQGDLQQKEEKSRKKKDKEKENEGRMQFVDPRSIVRYQKEHPEITISPLTEVAPRLGASRVIYVEIEHFQVQSPMSILLLKGQATANLKVVEVANGEAKQVLEEKGIKVIFPTNAPEGVVPSDRMNERTVYEGTLVQLSLTLSDRFKIKG